MNFERNFLIEQSGVETQKSNRGIESNHHRLPCEYYSMSAAAAAVAMKEEEEEVAAVVPLIISGYRFLPTDLELVRDYLCKKITNQKLPSDVPVVEYDIYSTEPWNLPVNNRIDTIDSNRSYYFVKLMDGIDRRHTKRIVLNHSNSNGVVVGGGYWKKIAGGRDTRYIRDELYRSIGVKKSFAFHAYLSSPPAPCSHTINNNNIASTAMSTWKTKWIMDEYSLNSQRTQPWVLCILRRKGGGEKGRMKAELEAEIAVIRAGSYYVVHLSSRFKNRRRKN